MNSLHKSRVTSISASIERRHLNHQNNKYSIIKTLYKSSTFCIYKAFDKTIEKEIIIKCESRDNINLEKTIMSSEHSKNIIDYERKILEQLREIRYIPKILDYYNDHLNNFLVIDYLGKDLEYLLNIKKQFSLGFCAFFMTEVLPILRDIHQKNVFHCDIKPANFIFNSAEKKIYLIDFSVAQTASKTRSMVGTPKFCSYNCHETGYYSPRDDLLSLGYVLLYFYLGYLPWQKNLFTDSGKHYSLNAIKEKKRDLLAFLKNQPQFIPDEFNIFFNYCYSLKINDEIDYKMLHLLFMRLLKKIDYTENRLFLDTQIISKNRANTDAPVY